MFKKKQTGQSIDLVEVKDTCTPAIRWVNSLLMHLYQGSIRNFILRKSDGIPSIPLQDELPKGQLNFDQVINRLKVLVDLDPIVYPERKEGHHEIFFAGSNRYLVKIEFDDSADDPTYRIEMSEKVKLS